jgi:hypothetical protein
VRPGPAGSPLACALAALFSLAAIGACGGDDDGATDAGADARTPVDAALVACSDDDGCSGQPLTPLCDVDRGVCVECQADGDCERGGSFGPACDEATGYCRCQGDDDCSGNRNGPYCDAAAHACTCLLDGDCAADEDCALEPYLGIDVRTCR